MNRPTHIFNALQDTIRLVEKRASAMETTMPSDPSGNGTCKIRTGDAYSEFDREYKKLNPMEPDAGIGRDAALNANYQAEHSGSDFDITISGEGDHMQDICKANKDDPSPFGTSMPADIEDAEKYAAYTNYSFEENVDLFNKYAMLMLRDTVSSYQGNVKTASAIRVPSEVYNELAYSSDRDLYDTAVKSAAAYDSIVQGIALEKQAMNQLTPYQYSYYANQDPYTLKNTVIKLASESESCSENAAAECAPDAEEEIALESLPPEDLAAISELPPEDLAELIDVLAEAEGESALEGSPEIAEAIDAVESTPEEELEVLDSLPTEKLSAYINKLAAEEEALEDSIAADEAGVSADAEPAVSPEEVAVADAVSDVAPEEAEALAEMSPEELAEVIEEADSIESSPELLDAAEALQEISPDELAALDELAPEDLVELIEEAEAVEDNPEVLDAAEALEDVEPEEAAALSEMSPDELANVIDEADAVEADPSILDQMAGTDSGAEVSPEEAVNELSSAMTEQNITPEELASLGKEGSAFRHEMRKYASMVRDFRNSGRYIYTRPKTARAEAVRRRMHSFLHEITRK